MEFSELVSRLTGISCPVFGVSWNPVDAERSIARRIIIFLEARRVLCSAYEYESVCPCINSVVEIRNYLTSELQSILPARPARDPQIPTMERLLSAASQSALWLLLFS